MTVLGLGILTLLLTSNVHIMWIEKYILRFSEITGMHPTELLRALFGANLEVETESHCLHV